MTNSKKRRSNSRVKVLIVEDSPTQAEKLKQLLEENGYEVKVATDGRSALSELRKEKPDLIISDVVMPRMDGFTLCKAIKSKPNLTDVPVVLLTALSSPQDVIQGLQCGADNFIRKPYEDQYLLSRIEYLQTNRRLQQNERITVGLKVRFGGRDYLINSDRQQILNLLISVFEEAVHLNEDLEGRQKELNRSYQSLNGLYRIAEGLNQCTSEHEVGEKALERALEMPGVRTGWVFLKNGDDRFRVISAGGLPRALSDPRAFEGRCLCQETLLSGKLDHATNVFECERLQGSADETEGLRYHASIPLKTGDRTLGLMNLASVEQGRFSNDDLNILYTVGHQVAVALERAELFEQMEEKVQERTAALREEIAQRKLAQEEAQRNLERIRALHEIDLAITSTLELEKVLSVLLEKIDLFLPCPAATTVLLLSRETGKLERSVCRNLDEKEWKSRKHVEPGLSLQVAETKIPLALRNVQADPRIPDPAYLRENGLVSYLGIPMVVKDQTVGVLSFYTKEEHEFSHEEIEFLATLAGQAAIAIHNSQMYQEMSNLAADLSRSNKVKGEFLSVMSHELRTPLNVVMGYTALLKERMLGDINPKQEDALAKITGRANDQLAMINNILYATVLEAQNLKLEHQPVVLGDLLKQIRSTCEAILDRPLALKWDCNDPLFVVHTDGGKLRQALQNLLDNAIKFTEKGGITVSARHDREQKLVEFKVSDTGIGIPKHFLPFIFDKFHQVDSSETRLYGGVGLGLYITRRFLEVLGGEVSADSEVGKGSTFTVTIPYRSDAGS